MSKRREPRQVYMLTFPNGMVYVGCTCDVKSRWNGRGAGYESLEVGKAIKEFGWENVRKDVVFQLPDDCEGSAEVCRYIEEFLIKKFEKNNYNMKGTSRYDNRVMVPVFGELLSVSGMIEKYGRTKVYVAHTRLKKYNITIEEALTLPAAPPHMRQRQKEYWRSLGYDVKDLTDEEKKNLTKRTGRHGSLWEIVAARTNVTA